MNSFGLFAGLCILVLLACTIRLKAITSDPIEFQLVVTAVPVRTVIPNFVQPSREIGGQPTNVSRVTIVVGNTDTSDHSSVNLIPPNIANRLAQIRIVLTLVSQPIGATIVENNLETNTIVALVPNQNVRLIQELANVQTVTSEPVVVPNNPIRPNLPPSLPQPGTRVPLVPPSFDGNRGD